MRQLLAPRPPHKLRELKATERFFELRKDAGSSGDKEMTEAVRIQHGPFGRVVVLRMDQSLVVHAHPQSHLLIKLGGADATFQVNDKLWPLTDNFAVGVNIWEPHAYLHSDSVYPSLLLVFYIEPDWLLKTSEGRLHGSEFHHPSIPIIPEFQNLVQSVLAKTLYAVDSNSTGDTNEWEFLSLMEAAMRASIQNTRSRSSSASGGARFNLPRIGQIGDYRVRRAMAYMQDNVGNVLDFSEVARAAGLSRPHFFELFRTHTSLTPNQYMNMVRMERAYRELSQTDQSICEVAANLGFSAQGNFTRFFRDHHGVSPSEYRRYATGELPGVSP